MSTVDSKLGKLEEEVTLSKYGVTLPTQPLTPAMPPRKYPIASANELIDLNDELREETTRKRAVSFFYDVIAFKCREML